MTSQRPSMIHALEFGCQAPLKFHEHCSACARSWEDCPDLKLGREILQGKKKLVYGKEESAEGVHAGSFACLAPLWYFEKTRRRCGHAGRCREEGLLLALLSGKKKLVYTQKAAVELVPSRRSRREARAGKAAAKKAIP